LYRCFPPRRSTSTTTPPQQEASGPSSYSCSALYSRGKQRRHAALWSPPTFGCPHLPRAMPPPAACSRIAPYAIRSTCTAYLLPPLHLKSERTRQNCLMALTPEKDGGPSVAVWAIGARARVRECVCVSVCLCVCVFSARVLAAGATRMRAPRASARRRPRARNMYLWVCVLVRAIVSSR